MRRASMERHQGSPCNMKYAQLMSAWWLLGLLNNFVYVVMLSGCVVLCCAGLQAPVASQLPHRNPALHAAPGLRAF